MTKLNFKCNKCNNSFELETQTASFGRKGVLNIEEEIICPDCGNLKNGEYLFPEDINKAAVGELYFDFMRKEQTKRNFHSQRKQAIRNYHPGTMVHYEDVFNQEELLTCIIGDKQYNILDSYCVMPDCNCADASLHFLDKEDVKIVKIPTYSFFLNYENKNISQVEYIDEEKAKEIANSFPQETLGIFKERHKKLKEELNEDIIRILKKYKKIPELPKFKIGRNEPCPCGSGIKYKRCCLNKDQN